MEPFTGTSSLLYASDLDTHPEYVAYALVHVDRLALLGSVRSALVCNLSYWFDRDDASRSAFASAAAAPRGRMRRVSLHWPKRLSGSISYFTFLCANHSGTLASRIWRSSRAPNCMRRIACSRK